MMIDPSTTMKKLRMNAKAARRSMSSAERSRASRRIADRFLNSRYFLVSDTIGCYISTWNEVDTSAIIERAWSAKKRVFLPVTAAHGKMTFHETLPETELVRNHFGLWQPVSGRPMDAKELDVVVTPLVAFDSQGNRIVPSRSSVAVNTGCGRN
jgi:5-formyltetrahydrofolate cyclo-ligase